MPSQAFLSRLGKTVYELYPQELAQKYAANDEQVSQMGKVLDIIEHCQSPITEKMIDLRVIKAPIYNITGANIGFLSSFLR